MLHSPPRRPLQPKALFSCQYTPRHVAGRPLPDRRLMESRDRTGRSTEVRYDYSVQFSTFRGNQGLPRPLELGREACCAVCWLGAGPRRGIDKRSSPVQKLWGLPKLLKKSPETLPALGPHDAENLTSWPCADLLSAPAFSPGIMDLNTARARLTDSRRSVDLAYERLSRVVDAGQLATGSHRLCEAVREAAGLRQGTHPPPLCGGRHARHQSWTCPCSCRVGYAHQGARRSAGSGREAGEGLAGWGGGWSA